jgi:hypothetical protein
LCSGGKWSWIFKLEAWKLTLLFENKLQSFTCSIFFKKKVLKMRFNCHFYFFSYHQRNAMIVHRAGKKILMKEMAEGATTIYNICITVSFMI